MLFTYYFRFISFKKLIFIIQNDGKDEETFNNALNYNQKEAS